LDVVSGKFAVILVAISSWNIPGLAKQTISFWVFRWQTNIFNNQASLRAVHFARRQYTAAMIAGAHILLYSKDPEADRAPSKSCWNFRR
jgi:hypothetical protein